MERGIHPTLKLDMTEGFQCLGHSNWTIFIPLNLFCSGNFPSFSLSYWEANSYYPTGPIMGKGDSSNLKSEWDRGFSALGAFKLDHLHPFKPLLFWKFPSLDERNKASEGPFSNAGTRSFHWLRGWCGRIDYDCDWLNRDDDDVWENR